MRFNPCQKWSILMPNIQFCCCCKLKILFETVQLLKSNHRDLILQNRIWNLICSLRIWGKNRDWTIARWAHPSTGSSSNCTFVVLYMIVYTARTHKFHHFHSSNLLTFDFQHPVFVQSHLRLCASAHLYQASIYDCRQCYARFLKLQ